MNSKFYEYLTELGVGNPWPIYLDNNTILATCLIIEGDIVVLEVTGKDDKKVQLTMHYSQVVIAR